ncbi:hypothetical protein [Pseudochelatococcus sp. G4_1912]|uniref:hypothetical protein n=1 Tax=Pseudochelatococcus sp. G4_1912 TaxID=3114288 RepID=UPI0039C5BC6A
MFETALIFAAGFLTASVLALLILPSVNTRATRLARRRLAAQFPISIDELTAQMDYIRAEGAVEIRTAERRLENERKAHALSRIEQGTIEAAARQKAISDEAQIKTLTEENAQLTMELIHIKADYDTKRITIASLETRLTSMAAEQTVLRAQEQSELLNADAIKLENTALRERIEAVASDIVAMTADKAAVSKNHAPAA